MDEARPPSFSPPMAPIHVKRRHQIPRSSSGQNVEAAMANVHPTSTLMEMLRTARPRRRHDDGDGDDLEPVLERLHEGDPFHAAAGDTEGHDAAEHDDADPDATTLPPAGWSRRPLSCGIR